MNKKDVLFTFVCILIVAVIMIGGVFITVSKDNNLELKEEVVVENETIEQLNEQKELKPYYFGSSIQDVDDFEFNAEFVSEDIDLENKKIKFTVLNPDFYDAVEVKKLEEGDKIVVNEKVIEVETIEFTDYLVEINGGFDGRENGVSLAPEDDNTYKSVIFNDLNTFAVVGETQFSLSENLVINDYMHGDYGDEPTVIKFNEIENYLNGLSDILKEFGRTSTLVKVVNNEVVSITRVWRP